LGIADNPVSSITVYAKIKNTRTNTDIRTIDLGAVTSTQNPSYATTNVTCPGSDTCETARPFPKDAVRREEAGGTYTLNNVFASNGSNGCFSISPLTPLDVRNCLCGRRALLAQLTARITTTPQFGATGDVVDGLNDIRTITIGHAGTVF